MYQGTSGDARESKIRAAACDQLVSVEHAWDLGMDALQMAVLLYII